MTSPPTRAELRRWLGEDYARAQLEEITPGWVQGVRADQEVLVIDLWVAWYGPDPETGRSRRHPTQERFIFGWLRADGQHADLAYLLGGRRLGKTVALCRLGLLCALLNGSGDVEAPTVGALLGRTLRETSRRLWGGLAQELAHLRRLGLDLAPVHDKQNQAIRLRNGSEILIFSYEKENSLERVRGETLSWVLIDEIERAGVDPEQVLAVAHTAVSDPRARFKLFAAASSPNGLTGLARICYDRLARGDRGVHVVTGTIYDNPWIQDSVIESIRLGLSRAMWAQEGHGRCLAPDGRVYGAFDPLRHVVTLPGWDPEEPTVIGIDWGTTDAYACAIKVSREGVWRVVWEIRAHETTAALWRAEVEDFIETCQNSDGGRPVRLIATDRAKPIENKWIRRRFPESRVRWLKSAEDQKIQWGIDAVSYMLDPAGAPPRLLLSDTLTATTDPASMGLRGAFMSYRYTTRLGAGGHVPTDVPSKFDGADHPVDALRYAVCCSRSMRDLHGGRPFGFTNAAF